MIRKNTSRIHTAIAGSLPGNSLERPPKLNAKAAVGRLAILADGQVECDYNVASGDVRFLTATGGGLLSLPFTGDPLSYAKLYLKQKDTIAALGLRNETLIDGETCQFEFGTRVEFKQMLALPDHPEPLPVRGGFVHIFVDAKGVIRQVTSTVRRGRKPAKLGKIISADEAVARAKAAHGVDVCETKSCRLTLSSHEAKQRQSKKRKAKQGAGALKLDPTYEVVIQSCQPASVKLYLVDARSGKVVHAVERLFFSQRSSSQAAATEPDCRYFPLEPTTKVALDKQLIDYTIAGLPDPTKLENKRLVVKVKKNGKWDVVQAKADGTFNYDIDTPEFEAVIIFVALNEHIEIQEKLGMTPFPAPLPVFVHDDAVKNNAYADPINFEAHIGVGTGGRKGLRKWFGYDKMVSIHEVCGHIMVTIMTPGHDLGGKQGADMHEAAGDFFAVLFTFTDAVKFAKRLKKPFTVADVQKDPRIIGPYSMDGGIRELRTNRKTPEDETGEAHDDGRIPGGAECDEAEALIVKANDINVGAETSGRIKIAAMALVPAHKVLYKDMLRAIISADETLNQGVNRKEIEKAFADHGITLAGGKSRKKPPQKKKKPGSGKKKSPGKGKNRRRKASC